MFSGTNDEDVRLLILCQYANSPQLEVEALMAVRQSYRITLKVRRQMGEENKAKGKDVQETLDAINLVWDQMCLHLEGNEEEGYCRELVHKRRQMLGGGM